MKRKLRKGEKRVEVSAIMQGNSSYATIAINPDASALYYYDAFNWREMDVMHLADDRLGHWNHRMLEAPAGQQRKVYRGIFTIVVAR